jgi:hypothetical protein
MTTLSTVLQHVSGICFAFTPFCPSFTFSSLIETILYSILNDKTPVLVADARLINHVIVVILAVFGP